jgi:hypothetical protein
MGVPNVFTTSPGVFVLVVFASPPMYECMAAVVFVARLVLADFIIFVILSGTWIVTIVTKLSGHWIFFVS